MWNNLLKKLNNTESLISLGLGVVVVVLAGVLLFNFAKKQMNNGNNSQGNDQQNMQPGAPVGEKIGDTNMTLPAKYTVKEGDDLWSIALVFYKSGYNWKNIAEENKLSDANVIWVGQELSIPKAEPIMPEGNVNGNAGMTISGDSYKVKKGDSLWSISCDAYNDCYKWSEISKANNLANPEIIEVDMDLKLPR